MPLPKPKPRETLPILPGVPQSYAKHPAAPRGLFSGSKLLKAINSPIRAKRFKGTVKAASKTSLGAVEQREVRRQANAALQAEGMVSKDIVGNLTKAEQLKVIKSTRVDGLHWKVTGEMALEQDALDQIARAMKGINTIEDHFGDLGGLKTLLHETAHSASPMGPYLYRGFIVALEEATTEMAARKTLTKLMFKLTGKTFLVEGTEGFILNTKTGFDTTIGTYKKYVKQMTSVLQSFSLEKTGKVLAEDVALDILADASIAMRRGTKLLTDADDYIDSFAEQLIGRLPGMKNVDDVITKRGKLKASYVPAKRKRRRR